MSTSVLGTNDICARVRAQWPGAIPLAAIPRADRNIALCIFGACERLGKAIKESKDRHLLIKEINATPATGVIDLSTSTYENIFTDTFKIPGAIYTQAESSTVFNAVSTMNELKAATPTDANYVWFLLRGKKLIFKNPSTGALNTYATALTLAGSYIPTIDDSNLPMVTELEDQLIARITEMIVKQLSGMDFLKMDEDMAVDLVNSVPK